MSKLFIVTGAPGAGKSIAIKEFIKLNSDYVAFDIDWLAEAASSLAEKSIIEEKTTWKPYRILWFEVLHSIIKNGKTPVLFAVIDQNDVKHVGPIEWCDGVEWFLLDCSEEQQRERLSKRVDWTSAMIEDALKDAKELRGTIDDRVDTVTHSPHEVGKAILNWLDSKRQG